MNRIQLYLREFRYQQWVKNLVVFLPPFFGSMIFDIPTLIQASFAFILFSISASFVYLINDYTDLAEDRKHPEKKHRPLASGDISLTEAKLTAVVLLSIIIIANVLIGSFQFSLIIAAYLLLNFAYSYGLKKIAVVEIFIVASFYVLRLAGGGILTGVVVSVWLYLVVMCGSLLFVCGKRLTEKRNSHTRSVLKFYSEKTLLILVAIFALAACLFIFFYSLNHGIFYIPQTLIFILAIARYLYLLQKTNTGESLDIIFDKIILALLGVFSVYSLLIIYFA